MDPSLSDPHHLPPFNNFNPFSVSNQPLYSAPPNNNNNNQFFQPPPLVPSPPSFNHPPYSFMICTAISALNEPDGSSKQAISRYIERIYKGIPPSHGDLMTHHLKTLKNNGVLVMVKKSYKLAANAGLEPPPNNNDNQTLPDLAPTSTQKRGRGRPPKSKPTCEHKELPTKSDLGGNNSVFNQSLPDLAPTSQTQKLGRGRGRPPKSRPDVQTNGTPTWEHNELPLSPPMIKRPRGRPRRDGALPTVNASVSGSVRQPSGRAVGRERKPAVVSAPALVFPYVASGSVRRRGRPKRVDSGGGSSVALPQQANVESGVVVTKRGRGRPPKIIGGVIKKAMKPRSGYIRTGRHAGRPRKGAFGQQDIGYGELKKKFELFQDKAKEIVNVLKAEVRGIENHAMVQAIHELEELTRKTTEETERMEEVKPDEQHPEGQGQGHAQWEAEDMQEALF